MPSLRTEQEVHYCIKNKEEKEFSTKAILYPIHLFLSFHSFNNLKFATHSSEHSAIKN